jgi:leucine-zipper-like transcriptional regulator 1
MNRKFFVLTCVFLTLLIIVFSCKKKTTTENNPPNKPSAPLFTSGENLIGDNITFQVLASDPDGDSISARFNWGDGDTSSWGNFIPSGDTITRQHSFHTKGTFFIKAQVKDINEETSDWSEPDSIVIQDSAWTLVWTCATPSAPWSPREEHSAVVFDNKMWVLGGFELPQHEKNDIWFSADGVNWSCATESAQWSGRGEHASVVYDDKIWVLGGYGGGLRNDVWYSSDGVNWTCATGSAGWSFRKDPASVVFDGKIWILGGGGATNYKNDVWFSADGMNWTCATETAEWCPRFHQASVVFDNNIWVLGGSTDTYNGDTNDIWYSSDGQNWRCATQRADFSASSDIPVIVFNGKVWEMGIGVYDSSGHWPSKYAVWYSRDTKLKHWQCLTDSAPWSGIGNIASVVYDNKIWILGGNQTVWYGEIVHGKR